MGNAKVWNCLEGKCYYHPASWGSPLSKDLTSMNETQVFTLKSPHSFPMLPPFRIMIPNLVMNLIECSIY